MKVLICVSDLETLRLIGNTPKELYLYGAFNQVNVCQMRARGTITGPLHRHDPEAIDCRTAMHARFVDRKPPRWRTKRLDDAEAQERFAILETGQFYVFVPAAFAYSMYERG
ncbi:MAG: hypothetical protein WA021_02695 [Minisyncoccia bacterium]